MKRIPSSWLSSERGLAHPKSSEQNRTRDNENANKGRNVAQSVEPEVHESVRLSLCFGVHRVKDYAAF
jgi:hypothetical protein